MPMTVESLTLHVDLGIGAGYVEAASPDTASDDALIWEMDGAFPGAQATMVDPYSRRNESVRAFFAALLLGLSGSAAVLIVERLLLHGSESQVGYGSAAQSS